jgi:hypothetical protein
MLLPTPGRPTQPSPISDRLPQRSAAVLKTESAKPEHGGNREKLSASCVWKETAGMARERVRPYAAPN